MSETPNISEDGRARARARFADLVADPEADPPLAESALVIALEEYPDLPVRTYLARLYAFSSVVADRVREAESMYPDGRLPVEERIRILNEYVFGDLGFRGNQESYYDPRNSYLNEVLDRRLGIPLTLSLVYMELAKGAGLRLAGVGFPGHFLVKTQGVQPVHWLDPYNAGAELGPEQIDERLRGLGEKARAGMQALRAVDNRSILRRLLNNLKVVYLRQGELEPALRAVERMLLLTPDSPGTLRELGLLCARLGRYDEGIAALERGRDQVPTGEERERLESDLRQLRYWRSRLN